ncbi:plasmid mobilization relaxosome protein MobC [Sphingomonas changnyeongensis]|uniref:Plasmid mobilization relaxosome protein MobC n=1 Tax=Sphingomonas changnyeongensis TaxID=2698679 RepID=A0A7Z2SAA0_9SPHN|nr:plasmid mobilization relaxosome protein MobC [Sphingomonas changnyeongensis]QHL91634.1 plasmid mobilization relaxosome protein MobC [Sphingomonas changnyeongensis]
MPGKSGSETRQRQIVRSTRWSAAEFARLAELARYSGCSEAELLRRLVNRASRQIIPSRELVTEIRRLGGNINQIARRLNGGGQVTAAELRAVYDDLLAAARIARS